MTKDTPAPGRAARSSVAAAGNLVTKVVIYPLAFVAGVVVDRSLGAHERGLYAFLLLIGNFILPLLTFGFGASVIYFISAGQRQADEISFTSLVVGFAQGLLSAAVTYALYVTGLLGKTAHALDPWDLAAMLAIVPLQGVQLMGGRVLYGESRFGVANWLNIARAALSPLALVVLVVVARMGLRGAVLATVALNVALTIATLGALHPRRMRLRIDGAFLVEGMRYGLKMWVGDIATRANLRLDQMLLGVFAAPAALGNYSVAVRISEFLWIGADSVTPVLFNRLARARDDRERIELTGRVHRLGLAAMGALAVGAGVVGWWGIPLAFGPGFREAAILFELLLPGTVLLYSAKVITKYFGAVARPELAGRLGLVSGVSGAVAYFTLIPFGTTIGAAIASSLSYGIMSATAVVMYQRLIAPERGQLFALKRSDASWLRAQLGRRRAA